MNREELSNLFTATLKSKLINDKYNNRRICDVKVEISQGHYEGNEYEDGDSFDEIKIKVKTSSPKGKNSRWENYYF